MHQAAAVEPHILSDSPAEKGELTMRVVAAVVDALIAVPVFLLLRWVPVIGDVLSGALTAAYWLLRDINGASPGKVLIGYRVTRADGGLPSQSALVKRNVLFALGVLPTFVPFVGILLGFLGVGVFAVEFCVARFTGRRIGDRWAGTTVVQAAAKP